MQRHDRYLGVGQPVWRSRRRRYYQRNRERAELFVDRFEPRSVGHCCSSLRDGNATVNVTVTSNASSATSRSTNLTIAGQTVGITQGGTTCTYALSSSTAGVPFSGGSGAVTVTAPTACGWTSAADPAAPWITVTSSGTNGTADVLFSVAPNPNSTPRSGTLTVAGQPLTVTQASAPCNYVLSSSNTNVAAAGTTTPGNFTFSTGTSGCSTSAVSYSAWITVSTNTAPNGQSGSVGFNVAGNPAGVSRTGTIQFAGQTFTITQTGAACAFSLNSYGGLFSNAGGSNALLGSQSALGCTPTVGTDQPSIVTLFPPPAPPTTSGPCRSTWVCSIPRSRTSVR